MKEPLISIIIPAFNAESTLPLCLDSIMPQLDETIEGIIINDGSKDETGRVCKKKKKKSNCIITINKKNAGVSSARNDGLDLAQGKWIMFVDSDDRIIGSIKECICNLPEECDLVLMGEVAEYEDKIKQEIEYYDAYYSNDSPNTILLEQPMAIFGHAGPWAKLYRRELIENFKIRFNIFLSISEDRLFHYDFCAHVRGIQTRSINIYSYKHTVIGLRAKIYPLEDQLLRIDKIAEASVRLLERFEREKRAEKELRNALDAQCGAAMKALPNYSVFFIIITFHDGKYSFFLGKIH